MPNFTFKKEPQATGLRSVCETRPSTQIKLGGKQVGTIVAPTWRDEKDEYKIRLCVKDAQDRAGFTWITLKARFDTEPDARVYILKHAETLKTKYELHQLEED